MDTTVITVALLGAAVAVLTTKVIALAKRQRQVLKLIEDEAVDKALETIRAASDTSPRHRSHLHIAH